MKLSREDEHITLHTNVYQLRFHHNRPFVDVETADGKRLLELFIFSSVHPLNGRDDTFETGEWNIVESHDQIILSIEARSTAWDRKTYRFACAAERFTYSVDVQGTGQVAAAHYFGGYYSESLRWGAGYFWSGQNFEQIFNPEPNTEEVYHVAASSGTKIDLMGVPIPGRDDWFFTPPPFCFAGKYDQGWVGLGVEAAAERSTFNQYTYHGSSGAFQLSL